MKTHIALLRGINVSGKNKLPMAELRSLLSEKGLAAVQTYIQSGNVLFQSNLKSAELSNLISEAIKEKFDYQVPVIILNKTEIEKAIDLSPFKEKAQNEPNKVMITFFNGIPDPGGLEELSNLKLEGEFFQLEKDHMHFYFSIGAGKAKMSNSLIERKLKLNATTRNWRTLHKLIEMAD